MFPGPRVEPDQISLKDPSGLELTRRHDCAPSPPAQHQGAGVLGSNLLRLGRLQPRALSQERGLGPKVGRAEGLNHGLTGGGHTLPSVWGLCFS